MIPAKAGHACPAWCADLHSARASSKWSAIVLRQRCFGKRCSMMHVIAPHMSQLLGWLRSTRNISKGTPWHVLLGALEQLHCPQFV